MNKWTRKYLLLAKSLADDNSACYSRKIGCVIISEEGLPISFGYNGSVRKVPHNDDPKWLEFLFKNLLTKDDAEILLQNHSIEENFDLFKSLKGKCIRKELGFSAGERRELCNCECAERNAIFNSAAAGKSTINSTLYGWFEGLPCDNCAKAIINSRLKKVVCLKSDKSDYSPTSRQLFKFAGIEVEEVDPKEI